LHGYWLFSSGYVSSLYFLIKKARKSQVLPTEEHTHLSNSSQNAEKHAGWGKKGRGKEENINRGMKKLSM